MRAGRDRLDGGDSKELVMGCGDKDICLAERLPVVLGRQEPPVLDVTCQPALSFGENGRGFAERLSQDTDLKVDVSVEQLFSAANRVSGFLSCSQRAAHTIRSGPGRRTPRGGNSPTAGGKTCALSRISLTSRRGGWAGICFQMMSRASRKSF